MVWLLLLFAIFLLTYGWVWVKGHHARKLLAGLPCYPTLPLLGNIMQLFGDTEHIFYIIMKISKISNKESKPFVVWFGPMPFVALNEVEDIKTVANTFLEKPFFYKFSEDYIGNGLITAPGLATALPNEFTKFCTRIMANYSYPLYKATYKGSVWKVNIKKIASTFVNVGILESYQEAFNAKAIFLVDRLKAEAVKSPVHIFHIIEHTSLLAILDITLGSRTHNDIETYCEATNFTLENYIERGANPLLVFDWIYKLTTAYKEVNKRVNFLNGFATKVINERINERGIMKKDNVKSQSLSYLDRLLDLHEIDPTFTHRQIISELNTVIVAGQGTLTITLTLILIMIGKKSDIQERLYAEMKEIFGNSKRKIDANDLKQMRYCEATINEALRLYPPVPIVLRHADEDLKLKSCTIPKDTTCGLNMWAVGHSEKLWGVDAEEFKPERWLEARCPTEFSIPFSIGKRSCIGKKYAMFVMKIILAQCIREFVFTAESSKLRLKMDVALKVIEGDLVQVKLRK